MPRYIEQLGQSTGMSAASGAIGMGMGLLLEGHNDRRQLKQQGKLQAQEIAGQKEMTDYNMMKQLEMWKNTSYGAQIEQMKLAGINPGLLYGMSGGGGATTGQAAGNVTGGHAPAGGGEAMGMGIQMMNMQLMKAQAEKLNAETENLRATTSKTGVEIGKIGAETRGIELNNEFLSRSMEDRVDAINSNAILKVEELNRSIGASEEERRTRESRVNIIIREAAQKLLENGLIEQSTKEKGQSIEESKKRVEQMGAQINTWAAQIAQGLQHIDISKRDVAVKEFLSEFNANHPGLMNVLGGAIQRLADGLAKPLNGNKIK